MTLPAAARSFLDAQPTEPLDFLTVEERRQYMRHLSDLNYLRYGRRAESVATVADRVVPTPMGGVRVREYRPAVRGPLPVHVFLHGGGWWQGSVDELVNEAICRYRCVRAGCVVLAVDYSLAPERPFPAALDEAYAVLVEVAGDAAAWGVDPDAVSVGGVSAGGNLAAALALRSRDAGGPGLAFQLLEVPVLDLSRWLSPDPADPDRHHADQLAAAVRRYLPDPDQAGLPLVSPLRAADLSGLPPAHVMAAEVDPLRVDGERYAHRLGAAGVPATLDVRAGAIHGVSFLTRVWPPAQDWQRAAAAVLRWAHDRARGLSQARKGAAS